MGRIMITQKEIAERAGVSRPLVGHVLQGRSNVAPETRRRIMEVARELGYHPEANWSARLLRAKKYQAGENGGNGVRPEDRVAPPIYLFRYERTSQSDNANLIYLEFFQGLTEAFSAWKRGSALACMLQGQTDLETVRSIVESGRASGIINFDLTAESTQYLIEKQFPMVMLNVLAPVAGVPCVVADHVSGYAQAWKAAVKAGHRRIAFVGYEPQLVDGGNFEPRLRQCEAGATAAGVNVRIEKALRVPGHEDQEGIWNAFVKAYGPRDASPGWPTLVFTANDTCATSLMASFMAHGVRVPEDISVIGFDDTVLAKYFSPALTTLSKPRFEMGKAAARLLGDLLAGREGSQEQTVVYPIKFIRRESFAAVGAQRRQMP